MGIPAKLEDCEKGRFSVEDVVPIAKLTRAQNFKTKWFLTYLDTLFRCKCLFLEVIFRQGIGLCRLRVMCSCFKSAQLQNP